VLIALGLSLCFRANCGTSAPRASTSSVRSSPRHRDAGTPDSPRAIVIVILVAGIVGAWLGSDHRAVARPLQRNEILVSLILGTWPRWCCRTWSTGPGATRRLQLPADRDLRQADQVPRLFAGLR